MRSMLSDRQANGVSSYRLFVRSSRSVRRESDNHSFRRRVRNCDVRARLLTLNGGLDGIFQ